MMKSDAFEKPSTKSVVYCLSSAFSYRHTMSPEFILDTILALQRGKLTTWVTLLEQKQGDSSSKLQLSRGPYVLLRPKRFPVLTFSAPGAHGIP